MAKTMKLDVVLAQCIAKLDNDYINAKGEAVPQFSFQLGTETFDVFGTKALMPVVGNYYYPDVFVRVKPLISKKTGNPYISKSCAVKWHEADVK
jgi:hypothetical protein